jgi:hypothetical protein
LPCPQHRNGRAPDPQFDAAERLYQRYNSDDVIDQRTFNALRVRFPGQSVTRSKYSEPRDVLHPDCCGTKELENYGVFTTTVANIVVETFDVVDKSGTRTFQLFVLHKPEETCYAHSEVWCNVVGNFTEPKNLARTAKLAFRAAIARKLTPLIDTTGADVAQP